MKVWTSCRWSRELWSGRRWRRSDLKFTASIARACPGTYYSSIGFLVVSCGNKELYCIAHEIDKSCHRGLGFLSGKQNEAISETLKRNSWVWFNFCALPHWKWFISLHSLQPSLYDLGWFRRSIWHGLEWQYDLRSWIVQSKVLRVRWTRNLSPRSRVPPWGNRMKQFLKYTGSVPWVSIHLESWKTVFYKF
jgi:hypothetical protein